MSFFNEKKPELLKTHLGQFALIKGPMLVGIFPIREQAYAEAVKQFGREAFLIKRILEHETPEQVPLLAYSIQLANI
ncbi:MAG: hypothetical protein HY652_13180 [Acidobacteria bacterium]|nr:hypothetical protein [Acidobacteriota bacterium]